MLAQIAGSQPSASEIVSGFETLLDRLRARFELLLGINGVRALFRRALYLSKTEFPWLATTELRDQPHVALKGLEQSGEAIDSSEIYEGVVAVLANAVWLLVTFIGEDLALPLVRDAWPDVQWTGSRPKKDRA